MIRNTQVGCKGLLKCHFTVYVFIGHQKRIFLLLLLFFSGRILVQVLNKGQTTLFVGIGLACFIVVYFEFQNSMFSFCSRSPLHVLFSFITYFSHSDRVKHNQKGR